MRCKINFKICDKDEKKCDSCDTYRPCRIQLSHKCKFPLRSCKKCEFKKENCPNCIDMNCNNCENDLTFR